MPTMLDSVIDPYDDLYEFWNRKVNERPIVHPSVQDEFDRDWDRYYQPVLEHNADKALNSEYAYRLYERKHADELRDMEMQEYRARQLRDKAELDSLGGVLRKFGVNLPENLQYGRPELKAMPKLDYDPSVRQVGQPVRNYEAAPVRSRKDQMFLDNVNDLLVGYDPTEGTADHETDDSMLGMGMFAGSFAPGPIGTASAAGLALNDLSEMASGRRVPGVLDATWLLGMGAGAVGKAAWMYGQDRLTRAIRKRTARQAARRALSQPDPNRTVIERGMFGRPRATRRYVDPSMEFTPYKEVR